MRLPLAALTVLLLATPALSAPGDPRALQGTLEWPASLSAEPVAVVRGDDGRVYYADVSTAQRVGTGPISGRISVVGVEGTRPHEIAAVAVGAGDNALATLNPATPPPAGASSPSASVPFTPPATSAATPGPATPAEDLWQVQGTVQSVGGRDMVVATERGDSVRVDVSKLSQWTRDAVKVGDQVKLFGVPQKDRRLVANGFIQVTPGAPAASPAVSPPPAPSR